MTTSILENDYSIRKEQYIQCIHKLQQFVASWENTKIIVVENNGPRSTYLDSLGCLVHYTCHNFIPNVDKGYKELEDVLSCINTYNISDDDFVVKMTGRYLLNDDSEFMNQVAANKQYDSILKYGFYESAVNFQTMDCITGLIGMRCRYVKQIEQIQSGESIEWKWAKVTYHIPHERIYAIQGNLGIYICPGNNTYFLV